MNRPLKFAVPAMILGISTSLLSGCDLDRRASAATDATAKVAATPVGDGGVGPREVFRHPAPADAGHDPRIISAGAAADAIRQSLAVVHHRLADLKDAYETKVATEKDLSNVTRQMQPLVAAARADCDAILRAARDMKFEYPFAKKGYEAAAALYRERGLEYRDDELREVELSMADEFDRLAEDVPRRILLTTNFIASLAEIQDFLAESDRCLRDTSAALAIFSAGPGMPQVSPRGRTFRRRLEEFITVIEEYQGKLFAPATPRAKVPTPRTGDPASPPPATERPKGDDKPSPPMPPVVDHAVSYSTSPVGAGRSNPALNVTRIPASTPARVMLPVAPDRFLRPGARLAGSTKHAGTTSPATMWVRERSGDEIAGDIYFATINGPARRQFRGRLRDGGEITIRGDRVEGNILPWPSFYRGRVDGAAIVGTWTSGNVTGSFRFSM